LPSEKTARSAKRKHVSNRRIRSATRTTVTKASNTLRSGELDDAQGAVELAVRNLDIAASKGVLHRNNAARKKSRLMAKLNALMTS
jgi:small subunit ribosomal protein S20